MILVQFSDSKDYPGVWLHEGYDTVFVGQDELRELVYDLLKILEPDRPSVTFILDENQTKDCARDRYK